MNLKRDSAPENFFADEEKWLISANELSDAIKQIEFVNNHLRTDVQIKYTFTQIVIKNSLGAAVLAVLLMLVKVLYPVLMY